MVVQVCGDALANACAVLTARGQQDVLLQTVCHATAAQSPSSVAILLAHHLCWAEAPIKIARMTLTIKLDRNWSSFQLANSAPPLSVTDSAIAPSARISKEQCSQTMCVKLMYGFA